MRSPSHARRVPFFAFYFLPNTPPPGVLQILDTKERLGYYTVGGVWLIRGTDIAPMLETSPEACVYTWTRIDHTDAASRQRVANYWCGEAGIDGENSYDSKVFK